MELQIEPLKALLKEHFILQLPNMSKNYKPNIFTRCVLRVEKLCSYVSLEHHHFDPFFIFHLNISTKLSLNCRSFISEKTYKAMKCPNYDMWMEFLQVFIQM